jgi:hypothetical protein
LIAVGHRVCSPSKTGWSSSSFCFVLNPILLLAILDGDAVHGIDQVNGTCIAEIAAREKGNRRSIVAKSMLGFTVFDGLVDGLGF